MSASSDIAEFIAGFQFSSLPIDVLQAADLCLSDLIASAAGGSTTKMSLIARDFAVRAMPGAVYSSRILFDGRQASHGGATFAGGAIFDSFDIHDGHRGAKGHAGAAVLPALLAFADSRRGEIRGRAFLTALVLGYEIGLRAGVAIDNRRDFVSSGAWAPLGVVAAVASLIGLEATQIDEALGIAEYSAPRSPVTKCLEHPSMLKDGIAWGALAGTHAVELAMEGFTGAPISLWADRRDVWSDLGQRWYIKELYFRTIPSCRMAQPAIEAAVGLLRRESLRIEQLSRITVTSFSDADRLMMCRNPKNLEQAQYSLPFILAAILHRGQISAIDLSSNALSDEAIAATSAKIDFVRSPDFDALWPNRRFAQVSFLLQDSRSVHSEPTEARGDPEMPFTPVELREKYNFLMEPAFGRRLAEDIRSKIVSLGDEGVLCDLLFDTLLMPPPQLNVNVARQAALG